jgi:hypothetical protein
MAYTDERLNRIYDRTNGYCHICHKKLSFVNYAQYGWRGAWEVDHSKPKAKGGKGPERAEPSALFPSEDEWEA